MQMAPQAISAGERKGKKLCWTGKGPLCSSKPEMATPVNLLPHHGEVFLYPSFFTPEESAGFLEYFLNKIDPIAIGWRQNPVKIFGKEVLQPRLSCSFADEGVEYGYSGVKLKSNRWTGEMLYIKQKVEQITVQSFNTALLNLYRDGKDYMGWHRDNEKSLGPAPVIASVSFGTERRFQLRNYADKKE